MFTDDIVHVLPAISGVLWAFIGIGVFGRFRATSPFVRALTLFSLLVAAGCFLDWYLLTFVNPSDASFAILVADVRTSLVAVALPILLLAGKWITRGHARYDSLLVLPVAASLALIWTGMFPSVSAASWGVQLAGEPVRYTLFVLFELAYGIGVVGFALALVVGRKDLPPRLRRPTLLAIGAFGVFVVLWFPTNVYTILTRTPGPPLFSSVVSAPALMLAFALGGRTHEEIAEIFRALSAFPRRVLALYVFYRTGEPLVAIGTERNLPIEAEQLEGVLDIVSDFVETSVKESRGYAVTSMSFDRLDILGVRGEFVIVAAVFEGPVYDALRDELSRVMARFEQAHRADLASMDGANRIANIIADDLSALLDKPRNGLAAHRP